MPRLIRRLRWTPERIEHIARHGVLPDEVDEAVLEDAQGLLVRVGPAERNISQTLYRCFARTQTGRYLLTVVIYIGRGLAEPISARDMTPRERAWFNEH
jgi:uncharacterized protein